MFSHTSSPFAYPALAFRTYATYVWIYAKKSVMEVGLLITAVLIYSLEPKLWVSQLIKCRDKQCCGHAGACLKLMIAALLIALKPITVLGDCGWLLRRQLDPLAQPILYFSLVAHEVPLFWVVTYRVVLHDNIKLLQSLLLPIWGFFCDLFFLSRIKHLFLPYVAVTHWKAQL